MDGTIDPEVDYVQGLSENLGRSWPTLIAARQSAIEVRELLRKSLGHFSSGDIDVIVFGSLARQEWTSGSDVDWTLLVDGQATPDHRVLARDLGVAIKATVYRKKGLVLPGTEGIFCNMRWE